MSWSPRSTKANHLNVLDHLSGWASIQLLRGPHITGVYLGLHDLGPSTAGVLHSTHCILSSTRLNVHVRFTSSVAKPQRPASHCGSNSQKQYTHSVHERFLSDITTYLYSIPDFKQHLPYNHILKVDTRTVINPPKLESTLSTSQTWTKLPWINGWCLSPMPILIYQAALHVIITPLLKLPGSVCLKPF
jgi:hypothetical protein